MSSLNPTLDKAGIVAVLCSQLGYQKKEGQMIVEAILETIKTQLEQGEAVKLSGFGNFTIRSKRSRPGRNPKSGDKIEITARKVLTFKPSQSLKDRIEVGAKKG